MSNPPPQARSTTIFFVQAALSFAVSLVAVTYAIARLPGDAWMRAFLWLGLLYVVTSAFTLAKCVRDQQEAASVVNRVDQVRLERLMAEYDPLKTPVNR
uniref:YiaA/YiaB family inner membrane protein n=1 Tax=Frankia tisae TaxID=2950104 RepID=UPI0021BE39CD